MGDRTPQQHTYFHPKVGIEEQFDSFSILIGMIIKRCDYRVMAGIIIIIIIIIIILFI